MPLGKDARRRARRIMQENRQNEDALHEDALTEDTPIEDNPTEDKPSDDIPIGDKPTEETPTTEPSSPSKKKRSLARRIIFIVLIVFGSLIALVLLLLILAIGFILSPLFKHFNDTSYVDGPKVDRPGTYVRPETEAPIYEVQTDENGNPIIETDESGNYIIPGYDETGEVEPETEDRETTRPGETKPERETIAPPDWWNTSEPTSNEASLPSTEPSASETDPPDTPITDPSDATDSEITPGESESAVEPPTDRPVDPPTEPVTTAPVDPPTEPATKPSTEPATKPDTEPATSAPTVPSTEPVPPPATSAPTPPTTEPPTEPATEPATEPTPQNGFYKNPNDSHLYYYENGKPYTDGLFKLDGKYYYARSTGWLVRGTTYYVDDGKNYLSPGLYVFDSDGAITRRSGSEQTIGSFRNNSDILDVYGNVPIYREQRHDPNVRNILLMGTDSRDLSETRGNSDVMVVFSINEKTNEVKMITLLRDMLVPIEGYDWNRINAAYRLEGAGLTVNTVNEAFGLDIQEFIVIDFNGVIDLIDYIGGVDVTLTEAEINYYMETFPAVFPDKMSAGKVHLNSLQALTHIRNRTLGTDFERTRRQKDVMIAIMNKIIRDQNVTEMNSTLNFFLTLIRTNIPATDFVSVCLSLASGMNSNMQSTRVPLNNDEYVWAMYKGMLIYKPAVKDANGVRMDMDASLTAIAKRLEQFLYG